MAEDGENVDQIADENKVDPEEDLKKTLALVQGGLSQLSKTADNTGFAYVNLNLEEKEIVSLYDLIQKLVHLRYANIVNNKIQDLDQFINLQSLLVLNATKNEIQSLDCFTNNQGLQYLQFLNVSQNKIKTLKPLNLIRLRRLILSENEITTCEEFNGHRNLEFLDISKNKIKNLKGIRNLPKMKELICSENEINNMMDLDDVPCLTKINMRQNLMDKLQFNRLPQLNELNIEANKLTSFKEFESLKNLPQLKSVFAKENPCCDEVGDGSKRQILMVLNYLKFIHGEPITQEDIDEMIKEREEKKLAEEERLKEEAIKREEERVEREKLEKEQEEIRRKEKEEQDKIEEQQREEQQKLKEEQDRIAEEERIKQEEEQRLADEEKRKQEEEQRLEEEEKKRLEEEEKLLMQEKMKEEQLEQKEIQQEEIERQKEEELQRQQKEEQLKKKIEQKVKLLNQIQESLPCNRKDLLSLFNLANDRGTDNELDITEIRFNIEKQLGLLDIFEIKEPIQQAYNFSKNKSHKAGDPEQDEKINFTEFKIFMKYFKKYLELMVLFIEIDQDEDRQISKEEFIKTADKLNKYGVSIENPEEYFIKMDQDGKGQIDFDHLSINLYQTQLDQQEQQQDEYEE